MSSERIFLCTFLLLFFCDKVYVLNNGLALTPPMGWMSWGHYECNVNCEENPTKCLNEDLIKTVANAIFNDGYIEAGYEYIIIDDCWSEMKRENGKLVADRKRFPNGMKYLADYVHNRGLKFGLYTNVGPKTCKGYPASLYFMKEDAETFAEWGVDYLKVDGCFVDENVLNHAYIELGRHLNKTGRPMVFSCSWPYYIRFIFKHTPNIKKISQHCNLWRDYHDIFPVWESVKGVIRHYEGQHNLLEAYHGPGHWFDPDMLLVGRNVQAEGKSRIQMTVYSMLSAPLLISCDMTEITEAEKEILLNMELLAIAQDKLGIPAMPHKLTDSVTLWIKPHHPLKGNILPSFSFAFVNMGGYTRTSVKIKDYGLNSSDGYTVYDIFKKVFRTNISLEGTLEAEIQPYDVVMYTLFPL